MSDSDTIIVDTTNRIFQDLGDPQTVNNAKDDGWKAFNFPRLFKNQGNCIQFVNTGK